MQDQIDAAVADLDALEASSLSLDEVQADVDLLSLMVGSLNDELALLQDDMEGNASAIEGLEADMAALDTELIGKQDILQGSCAAGSSLRVIYPDGGFLCENDSVGATISRLTSFGAYTTLSRNGWVLPADAECPRGWLVSAGGHQSNTGIGSEINISASYPHSSIRGDRWVVQASNTESSNYYERVRAVAQCVR